MVTVLDTNQDEAIAFLKTHASVGASVAGDVIQTHAAIVFLHDKEALKIKRAVKYDYLDFTSLNAREEMLQRELELNSEAAPGLYHDVVPLTRAPDGAITLNGNGHVIEWVLRMTRFPQQAELSSMADRGQIDDMVADGLGRSVAEYHRNAPTRTEDGPALISDIIDELERVMGAMHAQLGARNVRAFLDASRVALKQVDSVLVCRAQTGWVRRCHGDLHLRNIVMWNNVPTPFDALEFDERLGTCDVLYDLAFLLMDLSHRNLDRAANIALNAYLFHSGTHDHYAGLSALPLFLAIRAGIRAMVDVQTAAVSNLRAALIADAKTFLEQAVSFLKPAAPQLVAIGGLSGSGKTTVAHQVAPLIGAFPGAVHLRSDLERKAHYEASPLEKLPSEAYRPEVSDRVYHAMRSKARLALQAGQAVILDAVHATPEERELAENVAKQAGCRFTGIWLDVDTAQRVARVEQRGPDASDADVQVALRQNDLKIGEVTWHRLDAGQELAGSVAGIIAVLPQSNSQRP